MNQGKQKGKLQSWGRWALSVFVNYTRDLTECTKLGSELHSFRQVMEKSRESYSVLAQGTARGRVSYFMNIPYVKGSWFAHGFNILGKGHGRFKNVAHSFMYFVPHVHLKPSTVNPSNLTDISQSILCCCWLVPQKRNLVLESYISRNHMRIYRYTCILYFRK